MNEGAQVDSATDSLTAIREQILEQIVPLLEASGASAEERFHIVLQIAKIKGTPDLYQKAFEIAQGMEGDGKLDAYFDLLARIDARLQGDTNEEPDNDVPDGGTDQNQG